MCIDNCVYVFAILGLQHAILPPTKIVDVKIGFRGLENDKAMSRKKNHYPHFTACGRGTQ